MREPRELRLNDLHCRSIIDETARRDPSSVSLVALPDCAEPVRIVSAQDVLYVPQLRLQVLAGDVVPAEAVAAWSLDFERNRNFQQAWDNSKVVVEARRYDAEVCILSNFYSRNFGHWIMEELVKVLILEKRGFAGSYVVYDQPRFSQEFLTCWIFQKNASSSSTANRRFSRAPYS